MRSDIMMAKESIWKEKDETASMTPAQLYEWQGKNHFRRERQCKHYENGRCYSPFADSRACRCRGSIGCDHFKIN